MSTLTFEDASHVYRLDGWRLSTVTELIEFAGLVDKSWYTEEARERGSAVHLAIHYLNTGGVDWDSLDPRLAPYLEGYQKFLAETRFRPLEVVYEDSIRPASEIRLAGARWGLAGTLDAAGDLNAMTHLLDFKSGLYARWMDAQLELYARLWRANEADLCVPCPPERAVVCLAADGSYRIHTPRAENRAWANAVATNLMTIAEIRWKVRKNA